MLAKLKDTEHGGIPIVDHKVGFKTYKSCFTGQSLVDWLVAHRISLNREKAVKLGNALLTKCVFDHVTMEFYLEDSPSLYYMFLRV